MKIGYCTNFINTQEDGTGSQWIEKGLGKGFDYIELPLAEVANLSSEDFNSLKGKLASSGLQCEVCNNFFPAGVRLTGSEVDYDKIMEYLINALGRAEQLGVKVLVFGSPKARYVPEGFPMEKAWLQLVELLRLIDRLAGARGIIVTVEPLNKGECNIINTAAEGLKIVKAANRGNIKLLIDYYHLTVEEENPEIILEAADYIKHIHFADLKGRSFPLEAKGEYVPFINLLKQVGYEGRISVEAYTEDFENDAKRSVEILRQLTN